jgi:hypothetical protein
MSFALMQAVVDLIGIPLASKAVLLVLARHAHDDGTNSKCPSVLTIAEKAGLSDKGARNALRALEADGWIEAVGRKVGGRSLSTNYTIRVDRIGPPETRNDVPRKERKTRNHVPPNTRNHVPPNGHDTRNGVPPFQTETRNDVPLNPERRSAEYVLEEVHKEETVCSVDANPPRAHTREAPPLPANVVPIRPDAQPLPAGWVPSDAQMALARSLGLKAPEMSVLKFRDHWRRKGTARDEAGWRDAWEWWVRKDAADQGGGGMSDAARDLMAAYHDPNFDYGVRK